MSAPSNPALAAGWRPPPAMAWLQALREPALCLQWSLADWQRVVRLARRLRLLARLAKALAAAGLLDRVPAPARRHLLAEQRLSRWRTGAMVWALERTGAALASAAYPRVLLKGAAYIGQDLPIAAGRLPSDVDILVPPACVLDARDRLQAFGWAPPPLDPHDQRYYEEWSHEVAPMRHPEHTVELDLHHDILPPMARTHVDVGALLQRLVPSGWPGWQVLDPLDQVLHSASHLFHDSEVRDRLRDLVDLDGLIRHFGSTQPDFWPRLADRARTLGLGTSLALAAHFCTRWLGTEIPAATRVQLAAIGPQGMQRAWMQPVFSVLLTPTEPDELPSRKQDVCATLLLAHYHRNRMPLRILLPHLWHKMGSGRRAAAAAEDATAAR